MEDPRLPAWIRQGANPPDASPPCHRRSPSWNVSLAPNHRLPQQQRQAMEARPRSDDEPQLLRLAREAQWEPVIKRCQMYPSEAQPVVCCASPHSPRRSLSNHSRTREGDATPSCAMDLFVYQVSLPVYYETALGVLCSSDLSRNRDAALHAAHALLWACPGQVCCRQGARRFTPLHQAVENPSMFPQLLQLLLTADTGLSIEFSAIHQRDCNGLLPLDRILQRIHGEDQTSSSAVRLLDAYTQVVSGDELLVDPATATSPLLRLLSLGNSHRAAADCPRVKRVVESARALVRASPELLRQPSPVTGCLPLHVALRHYGNVAPLVELLTRCDCCDDASAWKHRNHYGDLPLHVACAVGVPLDVLHWVLAHTLQASGSVGSCGPDAFIWSTNLAGHTPIDLEWVRHLESGNGFSSQRVYYPLEAQGLRRPMGRTMDMYEKLLERAVSQEVRKRQTGERERTPPCLNGAFGLLLHRILLIIRTAFRDSFSRSPFDLTGDNLHLACALCGPSGPRLPRPLLDLIQSQDPEEISRRDHFGRTPLHYCFLSRTDASALSHASDPAHEVKLAHGWKQWVKHLLTNEPSLVREVDDSGRLPLHYALLYPWTGTSGDGKLGAAAREAVEVVVDELLLSYPESISIPDPVTRLYPYLLAVTNVDVSLEFSLTLLKRFPGAISFVPDAKAH